MPPGQQEEAGSHGNKAKYCPIMGCSWKRLWPHGSLKETDSQPAWVRSQAIASVAWASLPWGLPQVE